MHRISSEQGEGTTIRVLLPVSGKAAEIPDGEADEDDWRGEGKVLFVDDEDPIRRTGAEMLRELGFTPVSAGDGREAVEILGSNPDIAFVILGLTMPRMDGEDSFRELRQPKPDLKVILASGYSEHEIAQKFDGKGLAGFVQKPYMLPAPSRAIRHLGAVVLPWRESQDGFSGIRIRACAEYGNRPWYSVGIVVKDRQRRTA